MSGALPLHAGLVGLYTQSGWRGALLRGGSGAGKSDLTLRLIACGWRLVADDRVIAWTSGGSLWGRAAPPLHGLLEVRSVGVVSMPALAMAQIQLVVDFASPEAALDRIPPFETVELCGASVRRVVINPFEISAAHKINACWISVPL